MLGTSINNISNNNKITSETSPTYIQNFIKSGDIVVPYNDHIVSTSARYDQEREHYYLQINKYNSHSVKEYNGNVSFTGDKTVSATIKLQLDVISEYSIAYNYSQKKVSIDLVNIKTEKVEKYNAEIKATPSGELHIIWNGEDTGVVYEDNMSFELTREDDNLVINGEKTDVSFYQLVDGDFTVPYADEADSEAAKEINLELVVSYDMTAKSYTTKNYSTDSLNDVEKEIIEDSVEFFTQMVEDSIGIKKDAFRNLIVSSVVEVLLLGFGVFGLISLTKSKDE